MYSQHQLSGYNILRLPDKRPLLQLISQLLLLHWLIRCFNQMQYMIKKISFALCSTFELCVCSLHPAFHLELMVHDLDQLMECQCHRKDCSSHSSQVVILITFGLILAFDILSTWCYQAIPMVHFFCTICVILYLIKVFITYNILFHLFIYFMSK